MLYTPSSGTWNAHSIYCLGERQLIPPIMFIRIWLPDTGEFRGLELSLVA